MHAKKTGKTKLLAIVLAMVLVFGCAAGGTLAWLKATAGPVTNTFTVGDINIDLKEHELQANGTLGDKEVTENTNYKMVPGNKLPKDPFVTVEANSEACWLFIEVTKSTNFDDYMDFDMADGWTALGGEGNDGVYYRVVDATTNGAVTFNVLKGTEGFEDGYVQVRDSVTKDDLADAKDAAPTLSFTAYAVQKDNVANAAEAWGIAKAA